MNAVDSDGGREVGVPRRGSAVSFGGKVMTYRERLDEIETDTGTSEWVRLKKLSALCQKLIDELEREPKFVRLGIEEAELTRLRKRDEMVEKFRKTNFEPKDYSWNQGYAAAIWDLNTALDKQKEVNDDIPRTKG